MRCSSYFRLFVVLLIALVVLSSVAECRRRRRPGKKRLPRPGLKKIPKRHRLRLFRSRSPRPRPPNQPIIEEESKNVYYYSVPTRTQRPRIILGDDLNFDEMGILDAIKGKGSSSVVALSSPTAQPYASAEEPSASPSNSYTKSKQPGPRSPRGPGGPGYRLKENWNDHYVLEQDYRPSKSRPPPVMDSMKRAAAEFRNAYKAAILQSAKVAKFTTHTASRYFKGVRNIFGSDVDGNRGSRPGKGYRGGVRERGDGEDGGEEVKSTVLEIPGTSDGVTPSSDDKEVLAPEGSSPGIADSLVPKVYLDWGGSFWKMFYNKSKMTGGADASS